MAVFTIPHALDALGEGRLVGLPTDTVYGIAADPWSAPALDALIGLKGRDPGRPIALLVADIAQAGSLCVISEPAHALAEAHWPGPLTMVLEGAADLPGWIGDRSRGTVGVRVPDHPTALAVLRRSGALAVSSANRTGQPPAISDAGAREIFGDAVAGYLPGEGSLEQASTVVDVTVDPPVVLRPGPVVLG